MKPVLIYATSLWSCAGLGSEYVLQQGKTAKNQRFSREGDFFLGRLCPEGDRALEELKTGSKTRSRFDRAILLALACARELTHGQKNFNFDRQELKIVAGSARGSVFSQEAFHQTFLEQNKAPLLASPLTTPGFMASSLAQELGSQAGAYYLSSACLTSLQVLQMAAFLAHSAHQEESSAVMAVAAESCLTPYYIAQLAELGVLARVREGEGSSDNGGALTPGFIHGAFHPRRTGMVLAEGAAGLLLGSEVAFDTPPIAKIIGFGFRRESSSLTGISPDGRALQDAIVLACKQARVSLKHIDVIVAHGSGTQKGDKAELTAYQKLFEDEVPFICSHKWLLGHTLGASTIMSTALAIEMMQKGDFMPMPYLEQTKKPPQHIKYMLLTALGFGGQAGAMIVQNV